MAIPILSQIDLNSNRILSVANPVDPQDAATKDYVDSLSGGVSRTTATAVTASLANLASENSIITLAKTFSLIQIVVSAPCRVRLYSTSAARTADILRPSSILPLAGAAHGVIVDIQVDSAITGMFPYTWNLSPEALGSNLESSPSDSISYTITNLSGGTAAITVGFVFVVEES